jgi:hypothetical protein
MDAEKKKVLFRRIGTLFNLAQITNLIIAVMGLSIVYIISKATDVTTQLDHFEVLVCLFFGALFTIIGLTRWSDRYDTIRFQDDVIEKLEELRTCLPPQNN